MSTPNGTLHCTICGEVLPAHKPGCKHNPANARPAAIQREAPYTGPRITWSSLATHIKALYLDPPKTLTIRALKYEVTRGQDGNERKVEVLAFRECPQTLILNESCKDALFALFGDDVSACVGKAITLYAKPFGKRRIAAIRAANGTSPAAAPVPAQAGMAAPEAEEEKF
jgi:hypothetical protein